MAFNAMMVAAVAVMVAAMAGGALAQDIPPCATNLIPCAGYLNATTAPPQSCCGPLKAAAKDQLPCLCSLFNNTALLKTFNVNITQALHLAKLCGASADPSTCADLKKSGGSPTATPPSSPSTPSQAPAGKSASASASIRLTRIGMPGIGSLLLLWLSQLLV